MATAMMMMDNDRRGIADVATAVDNGRVVSDMAHCGAVNRR